MASNRRNIFALIASIIPLRRAWAQDTLPRFLPDTAVATDVVDFQSILIDALEIATVVDDSARAEILALIKGGQNSLEITAVPLKELSSDVLSRIIVAERNLITIIIQMLRDAKQQNGQIMITSENMNNFIKGICPVYPFC